MIRQQYAVYCDWHRYHSVVVWATDPADALKQVEMRGWVVDGKGRHLCPECVSYLVRDFVEPAQVAET